MGSRGAVAWGCALTLNVWPPPPPSPSPRKRDERLRVARAGEAWRLAAVQDPLAADSRQKELPEAKAAEGAAPRAPSGILAASQVEVCAHGQAVVEAVSQRGPLPEGAAAMRAQLEEAGEAAGEA